MPVRHRIYELQFKRSGNPWSVFIVAEHPSQFRTSKNYFKKLGYKVRVVEVVTRTRSISR